MSVKLELETVVVVVVVEEEAVPKRFKVKWRRRQVLVQRERAEGKPYDFGRFDVVEEPWTAANP